MDAVVAVWRSDRRARWFFGAHLQSGLGAGAGYIALLVLAYDRIGSAWGATAILLADLLPAMLLGPLLGAAIDRTSKLGSAILADVVRALAFAGLVIFDGTLSMILLAALAGVGTALFRPATYVLLPRLVAPERLPAANGLYGAVRETGFLLGPALAAGLLAVTTPAIVLGVNAVTFALCALALLPLRGHVREATADASQAEHGPERVRDVLRHRLVRTLIGTSAVVTLAAGTMNIAELVFAHEELGAGATGFGLLVSAYGFGLIAGSIYAGRSEGDLRRRYFAGLAALSLGLAATAAAPTLAVAMALFAVAGLGNGLFSVSHRTILHRAIPERVHGRLFGLVDACDCWGFGIAVIAGGALVSALGSRATLAIAGGMLVVVGVVAAFALRDRLDRQGSGDGLVARQRRALADGRLELGAEGVAQRGLGA
jgi:MFS family permease